MPILERDEYDDYKFLRIVDAMASINQKVNLIGVVIETGLPKKSKGTDCVWTLKIVDESHPSPGISVNVFAENFEKLPRVESAGDIVQLSHVVREIEPGDVEDNCFMCTELDGSIISYVHKGVKSLKEDFKSLRKDMETLNKVMNKLIRIYEEPLKKRTPTFEIEEDDERCKEGEERRKKKRSYKEEGLVRQA
ncbi:Nucleic acid-binding, OB-fold [Cynara cardunculus var. scolymus]|uniref:Nucleic acid-binding, OB-fold n=1 Tax=Cynara cardunculus var. scolymus TaxID=59895 RepID=A0A103YG47_CYNCS|nr:Nucleic acid-binding, OB-fold [Cynara cardunculus var. scolymus]